MKIDCGIIGLPNVGKSTVFKSLTNISVKIANFPFCTIQPNIATVQIPDSRLYELNNIVHSHTIMHSTIKFIDFAGLIKGAAKGAGLGNKILEYIQTVKILCHVIRCFDDNSVSHVENSIDPCRDVNIIDTELILFDILQCENNISFFKKKSNIHQKCFDQKLIILQKCLDCLYQEIPLRKIKFSKIEEDNVKKFNFLTFKPIIYIANLNTKSKCIDNIYYHNLSLFGSCENIPIITYYYDIKGNSTWILSEHKYTFNAIIGHILSLLKLNTFFTANCNMIRSWMTVAGTTALDASCYVHSDFKKGFIRVQIIKFNDFIQNHGELGSKKAGKVYYEGKKYCIQESDVLKFLFHISNVK